MLMSIQRSVVFFVLISNLAISGRAYALDAECEAETAKLKSECDAKVEKLNKDISDWKNNSGEMRKVYQQLNKDKSAISRSRTELEKKYSELAAKYEEEKAIHANALEHADKQLKSEQKAHQEDIAKRDQALDKFKNDPDVRSRVALKAELIKSMKEVDELRDEILKLRAACGPPRTGENTIKGSNPRSVHGNAIKNTGPTGNSENSGQNTQHQSTPTDMAH
jgi:myosin heavy subunit